MDELTSIIIFGLIFAFVAFVLPIILYVRVGNLKLRVLLLEQTVARLSAGQAPLTNAQQADAPVAGPWGAAEAEEADDAEPVPPAAPPLAASAIPPEPAGDEPAAEAEPALPRSGPFANLPRRESAKPAAAATASVSEDQSAAPAMDRESEIGGKWTVWAGGLTLAIGGVFLVKYAIDNNMFGPMVRVIFGAVLGLVLMAAGEWTRRRPGSFAAPGFESANIPATLTAAGSAVLFADIYAAHALYGFLSAASAFLALGAVAVLTMVAALLHGPGLAALGIAGSYAVPLLVSSDQPALVPAMIYILFVSAAAIGVGRARFWLWLAGLAVGGLVLYGMLFEGIAGDGDRLALTLYLIASAGLVYAGFVWRLHAFAPAVPASHDWIASAALSLAALPFVLHLEFSASLGFSLIDALVLLAPVLLAIFVPAVRTAVFLPVVVLLLLSLGFGERFQIDDLTQLSLGGNASAVITPVPSDLAAQLSQFRMLVGIEGALLLALAVLASLRSAARGMVTAATLAGIVGLVSLSWIRLEDWQVSARFGLLALSLALLFLGLAEHFTARFGRRQGGEAAPFIPGSEAALAAWVIAGLTLAVLAACFALGSAALTVALGLVPLIVAVTGLRHQLTALRWLVPLSVLPYAARLAWDPFILGADLGDKPFFNALLAGYGLPALGIAAAAVILGRRGRDLPVLMTEALAIISGVTALAMLALHAIDPGFRFGSDDMRLQASAVLVLIGGAVSLGLTRLVHGRTSPVLAVGAMAVSIIGMLLGAVSLWILFNPWLTGAPVGEGAVFNWVTYAYGLPALLYTALARAAVPIRPRAYVLLTALFAASLGFWFVNLTIRNQFSPVYLDAFPLSDLETYVYSIVWLLIGVVLLGLGFLRSSLFLRKLSGGIIAAVVLKVFLIDMSSLEGVMRALSFVGLGLTLMAIGIAYQRLVLRQAPRPSAPQDSARP